MIWVLLLLGVAALVAYYQVGGGPDARRRKQHQQSVDNIRQSQELRRRIEEDIAEGERRPVQSGPSLQGLDELVARDPEKALPQLELLCARNDDHNACMVLANCCVELKRLDQAYDALKQALRINPDYAQALYGLALTAYDLGRIDEAIQLLQKYMRDHPNEKNEDPPYWLGQFLYETKAYAEAVPWLERAKDILPEYRSARLTLGRCYRHLGRLEEAQHELKMATDHDALDAKVYASMARVFIDMGKMDWADEAFTHAQHWDVNADAILGNAFCADRRGEEELAAKRYGGFLQLGGIASEDMEEFVPELEAKYGRGTKYEIDRKVARMGAQDQAKECDRIDALSVALLNDRGQVDKSVMVEGQQWVEYKRLRGSGLDLELSLHVYPGVGETLERCENLEIKEEGKTVFLRTWDQSRPRERVQYNTFDEGDWVTRVEQLTTVAPTI